jgi:hypothetical protein
MSEVRSDASTLTAPGRRAEPRRFRIGDGLLYALLALLVAGTWQFARLGYYSSHDDVGYWVGVAGGIAMLLLFAYPLRKKVGFMQKWGPLKYWFAMHMVLGIAGPLLILLHSTFKVGSLNATVALTCMLIAATSGIVGRFLYRHVHRGLLGEKSSLRGLQAAMGFEHAAVKTRFHFAPAVEERLLAFEAECLKGDGSWHTQLHRIFVLPWRQWSVYRSCRRDLDRVLLQYARERQWRRADLNARRGRARELMRNYLASVVRVAQFSAYERLFALWHVLHVPFVYIMLASSVVHVIAVHVY